VDLSCRGDFDFVVVAVDSAFTKDSALTEK
jgi:hypothetical protein